MRIIWKSRPILNGPLTVRKSTPAAFQADMLAFHLALPMAHPDIYHSVDMGSGKGWVPVQHADFQVFIDMLQQEAAAAPRIADRRDADIEAAWRRPPTPARGSHMLAGGAVLLACLVVSARVSEAYPSAACRPACRASASISASWSPTCARRCCSPAPRPRARSPTGCTGSTSGCGCCSRPARWPRSRPWAARCWRAAAVLSRRRQPGAATARSTSLAGARWNCSVACRTSSMR